MENNGNITVEEFHKEIDLIQGCISRMANNSFLLKGWLVSIIAVILALSINESNKIVIISSIIFITISFWYLDAFFMKTEILYRKLYEWVIVKRQQGCRDKQYDLNPHRFDKEVDNVIRIMFSRTLRCFYGSVMIIIIIIAIYYTMPHLRSLFCNCK